jgi:2-polyprenyl-3-methyl-5-hydroxy-6-metoxy-1,4-benzoquinol methylase
VSSHTETSTLRSQDPTPPEGKEPDMITLRLDDAAALAGLGGAIESGTRLPRVKRLLLRVLRLITRQQSSFNLALIDLLRAISLRLSELGERLAAVEVASEGDRAILGEVQKSLERTSLDLLERLSKELDEVEARAGDRLRQALALVARDHEVVRSQLAAQQARVDMFLAEARRRLPEPFDEDQLRTFSDQLSQRFDALYQRHQDLFRGSEQEISSRLQPYLEVLTGLKTQDGLPVLDIGSGRGEWLQLLGSHGIQAYGVDVNKQAVEEAGRRELDVRSGDALEHLRELSEGTLAAVTAFHVVEHLDFPTLIDLLDAAHRALHPGGVIILETPNPTNLVVGASTFYLDPTHKMPLHPQLMEFLARSRGFVDVEVRFANPPRESLRKPPDTEDPLSRILGQVVELLNDTMLGPQDYAVIAHRPTSIADR